MKYRDREWPIQEIDQGPFYVKMSEKGSKIGVFDPKVQGIKRRKIGIAHRITKLRHKKALPAGRLERRWLITKGLFRSSPPAPGKPEGFPATGTNKGLRCLGGSIVFKWFSKGLVPFGWFSGCSRDYNFQEFFSHWVIQTRLHRVTVGRIKKGHVSQRGGTFSCGFQE